LALVVRPVLTDFFTDSPFVVEVERDLSTQQQLFDVVIVRRGRGRFAGRLPDGLEGLRPHNLMTIKSHHEALNDWAMKELLCHYVAYRKLISTPRSGLLPEEQFRLYAVCARFPHNLAGQVPWREQQAGVYQCTWGTDVVRVIVAGELPREEHNAPLHLFSASPEQVDFGRGAYRQRSSSTSRLLWQLFERYRGEDFAMPFTMEDFDNWYTREHFPMLTLEEQREVLERLPPERLREVLKALPAEKRLAGLSTEERLADLSAEEIRHYLEQLTTGSPARPRKPRRKK